MCKVALAVPQDDLALIGTSYVWGYVTFGSKVGVPSIKPAFAPPPWRFRPGGSPVAL